jgi:hypothetical protein
VRAAVILVALVVVGRSCAPPPHHARVGVAVVSSVVASAIEPRKS